MRKPAKSKAQRAYDKEKRLLLRLRKAAVKYTVSIDEEEYDEEEYDDDNARILNRLIEMQAAANAYSNNLTPRERKKMMR